MTSHISDTKICVTQGDTLPIVLDFHQDITHAVIQMQVRNEAGELLIGKKVTEHSDATKGQSLITLTSQDTSIPVGTYQTDMEITFIDGSCYTFYPPTVGKTACFCVTPQVTREIE